MVGLAGLKARDGLRNSSQLQNARTSGEQPSSRQMFSKTRKNRSLDAESGQELLGAQTTTASSPAGEIMTAASPSSPSSSSTSPLSAGNDGSSQEATRPPDLFVSPLPLPLKKVSGLANGRTISIDKTWEILTVEDETAPPPAAPIHQTQASHTRKGQSGSRARKEARSGIRVSLTSDSRSGDVTVTTATSASMGGDCGALAHSNPQSGSRFRPRSPLFFGGSHHIKREATPAEALGVPSNENSPAHITSSLADLAVHVPPRSLQKKSASAEDIQTGSTTETSLISPLMKTRRSTTIASYPTEGDNSIVVPKVTFISSFALHRERVKEAEKEEEKSMKGITMVGCNMQSPEIKT